MGSVFGGGGGGGGGGPAPDTTTQFIREAPGIEERKMELMDLARRTAQTPISIPAIQVQGLSPLEKAAIRQAGKTGVGAGTVRQGIQSTLGASRSAVSGQQLANLAGTRAVGAAGLGQQQANLAGRGAVGAAGLGQQQANLAGRGAVGAAGLGQQQAGQAGQLASLYGAGAMRTAAAGPSISQFFNPYQSYVIDEINRQAQQGQQRVAQQAISAGAFGGGREGVQRAEAERARLSQIGQAQAAGFESALGAAQRQQQLATQTGLQAGQLGLGAGQLGLSGAQLAAQTGLQAGQQLGALGQTQQQMTQQDINQLFGAGGLQRQIGQAQLDAARQTQLQRAAEPLQRLEFLSNIYAAGPKSTSGITAATLPQSSPLAQSIGTGLGVAQAYQGIQNPAAQTTLAKFNEGGIVNALKVKKYQTGGSVSDDDDESADLLNDEYTGAVPQYISPEQRSNIMLRPLTASLLTAQRRPGQSEASAVAGALGVGLAGQQDAALQLTKYDAAVKAAQEKAKGTGKSKTGRLIPESEWRQIEALKNLPIGSIVQEKADGTYSIQRAPKGEADSRIATVEAIQQIKDIRNLYQSSGKPTGFFESKIKRKANELFGTNPELASLDSTLELFNANFLKAMRGVQVSGIEQVKFEQILPNMNDAEGVFEKKMDAVEQMLVIRDKLQNGEISREDFLEIVNNTYNKQKQKITSNKTKVEEDGSVTISTGE